MPRTLATRPQRNWSGMSAVNSIHGERCDLRRCESNLISRHWPDCFESSVELEFFVKVNVLILYRA